MNVMDQKTRLTVESDTWTVGDVTPTYSRLALIFS